jgi:hypothetical protein
VAKPTAIPESSGLKVPLIADADGVYYPAAGQHFDAGYEHDLAPALVELAGDPDTFVPVGLTAVTSEQTVWAPASGQAFRLQGLILTADVAATLEFLDGSSGTTVLRVLSAAGVPFPLDFGRIGILSGTADNALMVTSDVEAAITGTVWGRGGAA